MPFMRIKSGSLATILRRTGVLTLVLALNISFSSLPAAVAYADTLQSEESSLAATASIEEVDVATNSETEIEPTTNQTETLGLDETQATQPVAEAADEVAMVDDESTSDKINAETMIATSEVDEPLEAPALSAEFDCWARNSLSDYSLFVEVDSDEVYELAPGTDYNNTNPASFEDLIPSSFVEGTSTVEVANWDGEDFTWTLGESDVEVSLDENRCEGLTIAELAETVPELSTLSSAISALKTSPSCNATLSALTDSDAGLTVFAPTNQAFVDLVASPATSAEEIAQLLSNLDELCALIQSHVVVGEVVSTDATNSPVILHALGNDIDGLSVQLVGDTVRVDDATVVVADNFATNGVVHLIDSVLLPTSIGTIDSVETDMTSPALSGTTGYPVSNGRDVCVVVRVDGTPYYATVDGSNWTIAEGTVLLNPTKTDTLFDVVVRKSDATCRMQTASNEQQSEATSATAFMQNRGDLLGLTMTRGVVTYMPEVEEVEPVDTGVVLGTTAEAETEEEAVYVQPIYYTGTGTGKGGLAATPSEETDPSKIDTDGDGVVDSEDPEPNNPDVIGLEDTATDDQSEDDTSSDNNVFWWFAAGGGAVALWYLLWQRSGKEF